MSHALSKQVSAAVFFLLVSVVAISCGKSKPQEMPSESNMAYGLLGSNPAAKEDIYVQIIAVLLRPASTLVWLNERGALQLTQEEKNAIVRAGIKGQLEVIASIGRGTGSREVRVVIIQQAPLSASAFLSVPESSFSIYFQKEGKLNPLFSNPNQSALTLEISQEKSFTMFHMEYPRDGVRYGGAIFEWDSSGNFKGL